jgi:GNAT superfamily N-acetyltransferase
MIEIAPMQPEHIASAAEMFAARFRRLRAEVPALPERMENPAAVRGLLERLLERSAGVAALEGGRLVGYLGWWLVDDFRNTGLRAGFSPEWAHAAADGRKMNIYRALYRAAAGSWRAAGCHTHAISLLARDPETSEAWFWNGFGLCVVDAVRSLSPGGMDPLASVAPQGFKLRRAGAEDAPSLAILEGEHAQHYAAPPVLMVPFQAFSEAEFAAWLAGPANFAYLATTNSGEPAGYLRFEPHSFGAAEIVSAENAPAATAAFVRPAYRGRRLARALLGMALREFSALGCPRCSVDFESFNPEAAAFWSRYFEPVCLSVTRAPELP